MRRKERPKVVASAGAGGCVKRATRTVPELYYDWVQYRKIPVAFGYASSFPKECPAGEGARFETITMEESPATEGHENQAEDGEHEHGGDDESRETVGSLATTQTKIKLNKMMNAFASFDDNMRIGTRQRRERDEHRLAEMRAEMTRLEKALNAEIKRRFEMNKSLQALCDDSVTLMTTRFEGLLADSMAKVDARLSGLAEKIQALEAQFEYEKVHIPQMIEDRTNELTEKLSAFMDAFETERKRRLDREAEILKRLFDHEQLVADQFSKERRDREVKATELKDALDMYTKTRLRGDDKFQHVAQEEIAKIQNLLVHESQTREREDDEIIDALNRYTAKLQDSLKLINSTEA
ncbi:SF-assemblin [Achlya hypogyna]|uniref:SF-assemblin n=1 Tax=Achlya hypogyna TaxID=1202772 RepID=A0A1V9YNY1_ACHHY|nr:SF-assemblin [Achlya hypogyna]